MVTTSLPHPISQAHRVRVVEDRCLISEEVVDITSSTGVEMFGSVPNISDALPSVQLQNDAVGAFLEEPCASVACQQAFSRKRFAYAVAGALVSRPLR